MLKGLEKRKQTLEAKLHDIQDSISERKDDAVDFKMMGIDHLFVDESHQFKEPHIQYPPRPRIGSREP